MRFFLKRRRQEILKSGCFVQADVITFIKKYNILSAFFRGKNGTKSAGSYSSNAAQKEYRISQVHYRPSAQQPWNG